ncbi:hypothetical protein V0288_01640 [Pannus brasiliensis CCIBt3594]|uniref:Bacterial cell division membrane protein n=1 Tax=Pannus brasiliensis CCIBt3594 TaxID=1427578 RepID=A0AAW9QDI1_9CHRO
MKERDSLLLTVLAIVTLMIAIVLGIVFDVKAALLGIFAVPAMVASFIHPRLGLLALLIYLPFSSTVAFSIVKVFTVKGNLIRFAEAYPLYKIAKDAFYYPALAKILLTTQTFEKFRLQTRPFLIAAGVLTLSSLITFFFVNIPEGGRGILTGIVGLQTLLAYIPLVLCGYYLLQQRRDLFVVNRLLIVLLLICCGLALVQYFLLVQGVCPDNEVLNRLAVGVDVSQTRFYPDITRKATLKAQCLVGGSVLYNPVQGMIRLPGTFSDPWQWGWFLVSGSAIAYAASFSDPSRRWRIAGWGAMGLVLLATLVSGQRLPLILVPAFYLVLLIATARNKKRLPLKLGTIGAISFLSVLFIPFLRERALNLIARWQASPPTDFVARQIQWILRYVQPFGFGLGEASSGARRLADEDGTRLIETYYAKLFYEVGIVGFVAFMIAVTILCVLTWRAYRSLRTPAFRHWGLCIWIFILFISYNPYYYPLSVEPVSIYYWLFAGFLLKLPEIEERSSGEDRPATDEINSNVESSDDSPG